MTAHYNLDAMQYAPPVATCPATFLPEHTPQGAEWWASNANTPEASAILAFLQDAHTQLVALNAQHKVEA